MHSEDFPADVILNSEQICNLKDDLKTLLNGVNNGKKFVIYGFRNTGKTSLIKSLLIPKFKEAHPESFVFFVDFLGISNHAELNSRVRSAFEKAFTQAFPVKNLLTSFMQLIKGFRPVLSLDPQSGTPALSIEVQNGHQPDFVQLLEQIPQIVKKMPVLLVFDEFQDICNISEAQGLFRDLFQNYPSKIPIIVLGSKKHLLTNIFAKPNSPFANWGEDLEIKPIPYHEYFKYITERFKKYGITMSEKNCEYLQNYLQRIPEAINIVCKRLVEIHGVENHKHNSTQIVVAEKEIHLALKSVLLLKQSRLEEYLSRYSSNAIQVLIQLAKQQPVKNIQSITFVASTGFSSTGVRKIITKFLDTALVYKTENGYIIGDPIIKYYLISYR